VTLFTILVLPVLLLILGAPVFAVIMASATIAMIFTLDLPITLTQTELFGGVNNYSLIAVPFFIFAGAIMTAGRMSERLVNLVLSMIGWIRGGLGATIVGAATVFGAISGSSPATVAAIGGSMYPSLLRNGYPDHVAAGLIASSGAIAGIIPPSIALILYSVAAEESVRDLFIAGILPGMFISLLMATYIVFTARRLGINDKRKWSLAGTSKSIQQGSWALGMPLIILGGIYGGIFSPTEAAGIACIYAAFVSLVVYRSMSLRELWKVAADSVFLTAQVLLIVAAASIFSRMITILGIPQDLVLWISGYDLSPIVLLLALNLFLLAVGCLLDPVSAILVLAPILKPIVIAAGIDPVHFGVVMTVNLMIGMFTPPFGLNIFVAQGVFRLPIRVLYRGIMPFVFANVVALIVVSFWPALSLFLVGLL